MINYKGALHGTLGLRKYTQGRRHLEWVEQVAPAHKITEKFLWFGQARAVEQQATLQGAVREQVMPINSLQLQVLDLCFYAGYKLITALSLWRPPTFFSMYSHLQMKQRYITTLVILLVSLTTFLSPHPAMKGFKGQIKPIQIIPQF